MYELTTLYLYKVVFSAELMIAELMLGGHLVRRQYFALRYGISCVLMAGVAFAIPVLAYNALYCSAIFLVLFALSVVAMKFCYAENGAVIIFCGIAAYSVQHIAYQLFDLAMLPIGEFFGGAASPGGIYGSGNVMSLPIIVYAFGEFADVGIYAFAAFITYGVYVFVYFAVYAVSSRLLGPLLKKLRSIRLEKTGMLLFTAAFTVFNIFVSAVATYAGASSLSIIFYIMLGAYNICCCAFVLFVMMEAILRRQFQKEYTAATYLWHKDREQYKLLKENIELINLKCHDLKHQIHLIGRSNSVGADAIADMEKVISIYDSGVRTGNEALDVILTEKSLYCNDKRIRLYCIADGNALGFVENADLYSLFGNIIDNALEAVEKLGSDKRFIKLFVGIKNEFPVIRLFNYFEGELSFANGLPVTTKGNDGFHGYGMKSVRRICDKYDADMEINAHDGMFILGIVFMKR
ncbi:MAG TPA: GHKL domain-containing protein [Firmicutes bacterium]|nr:GHKL domain-containing protein [Bacillota bacterium]